MNAIQKQGGVNETLARLQSGAYQRGGEVLDWSYYDTVNMLNTTGVHHMFTAGLGGASGKTLRDTNMMSDGKMPQGERLFVKFIKITYVSYAARDNAAMLDLYQMIEDTTAKIKVQGKDSMGTFKLAELFGSPFYFQLVPTNAGDNVPLINGNFTGIKTLNKVLILPSLTTFEVELQHHVLPADTLNTDRLTIYLCGRLERLA